MRNSQIKIFYITRFEFSSGILIELISFGDFEVEDISPYNLHYSVASQGHSNPSTVKLDARYKKKTCFLFSFGVLNTSIYLFYGI